MPLWHPPSSHRLYRCVPPSPRHQWHVPRSACAGTTPDEYCDRPTACTLCHHPPLRPTTIVCTICHLQPIQLQPIQRRVQWHTLVHAAPANTAHSHPVASRPCAAGVAQRVAQLPYSTRFHRWLADTTAVMAKVLALSLTNRVDPCILPSSGGRLGLFTLEFGWPRRPRPRPPCARSPTPLCHAGAHTRPDLVTAVPQAAKAEGSQPEPRLPVCQAQSAGPPPLGVAGPAVHPPGPHQWSTHPTWPLCVKKHNGQGQT